MRDPKKWWKTAQSEWIRIKDMADSHLQNTIKFLERKQDTKEYLHRPTLVGGGWEPSVSFEEKEKRFLDVLKALRRERNRRKFKARAKGNSFPDRCTCRFVRSPFARIPGEVCISCDGPVLDNVYENEEFVSAAMPEWFDLP